MAYGFRQLRYCLSIYLVEDILDEIHDRHLFLFMEQQDKVERHVNEEEDVH